MSSEQINFEHIEEDETSRTSGLKQGAVVYGYRDRPFKAIEDLVEIVVNPDPERVSTQPPFRPKASEIYVYECEQKFLDKRTWTFDGYRWRNNGKHKYPKPNPLFEKVYFHIENPMEVDGSFRRCAYIPLHDELNYMVVQYLSYGGSVDTAPWEPNRSGFQLTPMRSDPVLQDSDLSLLDSGFTLSAVTVNEGRVVGAGSAVKSLYPSPSVTDPGQPPQPSTSGTRKRKFVPLSITPVNPQKSSAAKRRNDENDSDVWVDEKGESVFRFSKKTFTSIVDLCFKMRSEDYFWSFHSVPDVILVFGSCELLSDLKDLLTRSEQHQVLNYTTSPCLDGFYISVLSYIHPKFVHFESKNSPAVIPLAFMIHQNRNFFSHASLFNILKEHLSSLQDYDKGAKLAIVSERDIDVMRVIKKSLPNCINLLSLAHIKKEGQCWLTKNMQSKRGDRYMAVLEKMMKASSKSEFECLLQNNKENCSRSWLNFFEVTLLEDLVRHSNNWMMIKEELFYQDILEQHQSPALEQVLDDLELHHDATMDKLVESLFLLQQFFIQELRKARCGLGTIRLAQKYHSEATNSHSLEGDQYVVPPSLIVRSVMDKMDDNPESIASDTADQGEIIKVKQEVVSDNESNSMMVVIKNFSDADDDTDREVISVSAKGEGSNVLPVKRYTCSPHIEAARKSRKH